MATAVAKKHEAIPYIKIAKLYGDGLTDTQVAKKIGRYNESYPDPTKSMRAIKSRMKTLGYIGENGKLVHLKTGKPAKTKVKVAHVKATPKVVKVTKTVEVGKAIAIMVTADGKHVKVMVPSLTNLIPIGVFEAKVGKVMDVISDLHIAAENEAGGDVTGVEPVVESNVEPNVSLVEAADTSEDDGVHSVAKEKAIVAYEEEDDEPVINEDEDQLEDVDVNELVEEIPELA